MRFRLRYQQHNLELPPGQFLIGRSTECQLSLDDPLVSRKHARLLVTEDGVYLEDLGSRNGVLVNGTRTTGRTKCTDGDRITVGSQEMLLVDAMRVSTRGRSHTSPFVTEVGAMTMTSLPSPTTELPAVQVPATLANKDAPPVEDEMQKRLDALNVLSGLADKSFAMGRAEDAERILQQVLNGILEGARERKIPTPELAEAAARSASKLANATGKGQWIDYVFELYTLTARLLPANVVDDLYQVLRKAPVNLTTLRGYLAALRRHSADYGPADRFLLQRAEGLERLAASK